MRSILVGVSKAFCLSVLALLLVSCGGGGGGGNNGGGFTGQGEIKISITADKTLLPVNTFGSQPAIGGPFTNTFTVRVETANGDLLPADPISVDLNAPEGSGALAFLDGDTAHQEDNPNPPPAKLEKLFRRLVFEKTTGIATGHFHAGGVPGTVTLVASAVDPNTNQSATASLQITVGQGASTGKPAIVQFQTDASPLYITGQGQVDVRLLNIFVSDDGGQPVPNPTGNNVRVELLPGRPNGGEKLVSVNAAGGTEEGTVVNTHTINGVAQVSLSTGTLPGTVRIAATVDRSDNDVGNGIQSAIADVTTIPIGSGEIVSLTFTGPYPGAVAARQNTLDLGVDDFLNTANGVYSRLISVVAADQFGNPPPEGQPITFRLIDSPSSGYPTNGRGTFDIGADDGNPQEGGFTFATETSSLAGTKLGCLLFFGGIPPEFNNSTATVRPDFRPDQEGSRIITGISGLNLLSVNTAFNTPSLGAGGTTIDTGFTVPYIVGCAPHFGNVQNNPGDVNVLTSRDGVASTIMNYPRTQLGRHMCLAAEANGGKVGALLCHWYLGVPTNATLKLIPPEDATFNVLIGQADAFTKTITVQLFDGATPPSPLPAETIAVQVDITDPDKTDAIAAEKDVAVAEATLEASKQALADFISDPSNAGINFTTPVPAPGTPNDCLINTTSSGVTTTGPNPAGVAACKTYQTLQDAVDTAQTALADAKTKAATAKAKDDAYAFIVPIPDPVSTDANGIARITLSITDMPPNGKVTYSISTVGPEILAPTVTVTANPSQGGG